MDKHSLNDLLAIAGLARATYFYQKKHLKSQAIKDDKVLETIKELEEKNYHKYGVRRMTIALQNKGYIINHKRVERIMKLNGIAGKTPKKKYHSFKGEVGRIAPNVINRDFKTERPYEKIGTDVTQFITKHGKLYLSHMIDFHTREILAYDIARSPNMNQIRRMMSMLITNHGERIKGSILHSDQGWQYQMRYYRKSITDLEMIQSMSRKGNCLDNSPTESSFGCLKNEMYYDKEYTFKSIEELEFDLKKYIHYYNHDRIVTRLKTSPVEYRLNCCK